MGLGGSSALAVAIVRALNRTYELALPEAQINALAFECEQAAHGRASGVDNTVATYGTPLYYQRQDDESKFETLSLGQPLDLVIGITGKESLTAETVAQVRRSWQQYPDRYETIFDQIGALTQSARTALQNGQLQELGELMNLCHGYLNALQLSTPKLEDLIHIARSNGAVGAKLTGGGGGGSMVALCPDSAERVRNAMQAAGYKTLSVTLD
jgi:hydroxymethylglutaryl-CoA reductase